jgi:hypothetical protein
MSSKNSQTSQVPAQLGDEEKHIVAVQISQASSVSKEGELQGPLDEDEASVAVGDIQFKNLTWWQCGFIMIAETVSLGILSLPSVLAVVGLIPGFIMIVGLGIFASYSGYAIGQFKERYPRVHSMADAFEIFCTPIGCPKFGKELGGAAQTLMLVFSMASHILTWVICFDTITGHATCNIVWGVVALVVFWLFDLPRTLKNISYWSIACCHPVARLPNKRFADS